MAIVPPESLGSVNTHPVGTGPFRFQEWTPGEHVVLVANEDYYDGRPYLDSITFQFYADENEMYDDFWPVIWIYPPCHVIVRRP